MAEHTILLVDGDAALCERIQAALAPYGCRGVHLPDANEALTYPLVPSLIVLCIDPKRLGWASAMRIRKHPVLRNVPLVVTSAEATEKDFDEHKKLKTRADEYERKPLSVDRLVDKIRALLGGLEVLVSGEFDLPPSADSEELSLDDAVEIQPDDFEEDPSDRTRVGSMADIMHHETDAAFAQISLTAAPHDENETTATHGPEGALAAGGMAIHSTPRMSQVPPAVLMAQQVPHVAQPLVSAPPVLRADPMLDARTLSDEEDDAPAESLSQLREERDRLLREVAELKSKAVDRAPPGPAASREILSLREVINRKEKELLDVKDAFDTKDREILNVRERLRESDKARRELDEKLLSVEKELISALEKNEAQARDKELAHDRERGFKGRLEDALKKLERAHAEIEEWKHRHGTDLDAAISAAATVSAKAESDIVELRRGFDEERAGLAETHEAAQAELMESHQREKAALLAVHADGHSAHAAEKARIVEAHAAEKARIVEAHAAEKARIAEAHEGEKAALVAAHEEGRHAAVAAVVEEKERLSARIAELESAVAGHEAAREKAAEAEAQALLGERDAGAKALESLRAEHLAKLEEKEAAHRAALAEAERARAEMTQAHQAKLDETRSELMQSHQEKLSEAERAREELMQAHQAKLEEARADKAQAVEALSAAHAQTVESLVARHAEGSQVLASKAAELELAHASLVERHETERSERERLAEETAALREEAARREARLSSLEAENAAFQEQILKAYHRLKTDEHVVARARKALAIALTLLDDTATTQDTKSS